MDMNEAEAKQTLISKLHIFLEERILYAREAIIQICIDAIRENDVILTMGSSPLLRKILVEAAKVKSFKLIIVDCRPLHEGLLTVAALSPGMHCVYTTLAGTAASMKEVTKVLLGASALLANGAMLAPAGTAMLVAEKPYI